MVLTKTTERGSIKRFINLAVVVIFSFVISGCATIMQGTTQSIGISSTPSGAKVTVDNMDKGQTPLVDSLSRKDNHIVQIELAGYEKFSATLTRSTSGWVWGNIAFGGLIGLVVDAVSGGMYKLTPEQIQATLQKSGTALLNKQGDLLVAVVLQPDHSWEKIGQLTLKK